MGGDRGPEDVVAGALEAASRSCGRSCTGLRGSNAGPRPGRRRQRRSRCTRSRSRPCAAKTNSSLVLACRAVGEGEADAVVSAGNTGATLAARFFHIRRSRRSTARRSRSDPARDGSSVLLDSGANADARPEHLLQFAQMGAIFSHEMLEVADPGIPAPVHRRGARERQPAHARGARAARRERPQLRGERREPPSAEPRGRRRRCDGFTGNVCLKLLEGTIKTLLEGIREEIKSRPRKIGGLLTGPPRACGNGSTPTRTAALIPRAQRARRDRPWKLVAEGDRQRDSARRARRGAPHGGQAGGAASDDRVSIRALRRERPKPG